MAWTSRRLANDSRCRAKGLESYTTHVLYPTAHARFAVRPEWFVHQLNPVSSITYFGAFSRISQVLEATNAQDKSRRARASGFWDVRGVWTRGSPEGSCQVWACCDSCVVMLVTVAVSILHTHSLDAKSPYRTTVPSPAHIIYIEYI